MDIELPNGVVIQDVPEGTTQAQVMAKAIAAGLATREDFSAVLGIAEREPQTQTTPYQSPSFGEQIIGAGETGLTLLTGGTTGLLGTVGGALTGAYEEAKAGQFGTPQAARRIEERAALGGQQYTYAPRTQAGQEQVKALGEIGAELVPLQPVLPSGLLSGGKGQVVPAIRQATADVRAAARDALPPPAIITGRVSGGSAATPMELVRKTTAESLPVPVTLTKGARTREAEQLAFEKEQMKGQLHEFLRL